MGGSRLLSVPDFIKSNVIFATLLFALNYRDRRRCIPLTDAFNNDALKLIHTATPDKTRLSRMPVDRRRCDAGQADSYA